MTKGVNRMDKPRVLTEFAKFINSDRYQYTESDIFLQENMQNKEAVFDVFLEKLKIKVLLLYLELQK